jgi:hypothetical protein
MMNCLKNSGLVGLLARVAFENCRIISGSSCINVLTLALEGGDMTLV